jgi:L-seryl-tRNA(Ser) seleniumtransferase
MNSTLLRQIPAIDRWLGSPLAKRLCAEFSREAVTSSVRDELAQIRRGVSNGAEALPDFEGPAFEAALRERLEAAERSGLHTVINATGIILHTNLGRSPLCKAAVDAVREHAGAYTNLEFDLNTGKRGSRNLHAARLICDITGAEDALVVNNCAAAVVLVLSRFCRGRRVVISRGELIEIGGSFRMPDVIAESGAYMTEVGTTNRTSLDDYGNAIDSETRMLLASHPSNYRVVGFAARPGLSELATLARSRGCLSLLDLGSGCLVDLARAGFGEEPSVQQCLRSGVDLVTFSGDKLLGGPQAGIIAGRRELVEQLRGSPLARAMRIDKLSLTALVATLQQYLPPHDPFVELPVLRMLTEQTNDLSERTHEFATRLAHIEGIEVEVVDTAGFAGGGTLPAQEIPGKALRLIPASATVEALAAKLRLGTPPVIGRIRHDALHVDLRTVFPEQQPLLIECIAGAVESFR